MGNLFVSPAPDANRTLKQSVSKTLTGSNTTVATPLWRVTGTVLVTRLWGVITTVLGSNHTAAYWRLNDQTAQVDITLATGTTLSSAAVGSTIQALGLAGAALTLNTSAAGRVIQAATVADFPFTPFELVKKSGANTDVEYVYTTTNTPTSGVIQFFIEYLPLSADGALTAQ